jgi:hypothetical protein
MRRRLAAVVSVLGFVTVAAMAVAPASTRAASSVPSGRDRALYQLPELQWKAAHNIMPTGITASQTAPAGNISKNIQFLSNLPLTTAISIAFIGHVAYVSTVLGVYSVDISDPTNPQVLSVLPMYIWENEAMTADPARNLIFIARDPRGFTSPLTTAFPYGALHVIDVSNPRAMVQVGYHIQPTGHTAACINNCSYLWIVGPASPAVRLPGASDPTWGGRPTWGVDITNPLLPADCPAFIDVNNHNGFTDYDHHVDVDADGVAWITGSGHIRGYWTNGDHYNYVHGKTETATACSPIPYAGGNTYAGQITVQGGVIHNSRHNLNVAIDGRAGDVVAATEEVITTDCAKSGALITYDIGNSKQAQGWTDPNFTLTPISRWTPEHQPGSTGCDSSHWFMDNGSGLIAQAFYSQGTRILDINDPHNIKEVGWYNVQDQTGQLTNNTWATYWYNANNNIYIVVADFQRGLDILRFDPNVAAVSPGTDVPDLKPGVAAAIAILLVLIPVLALRRRTVR